jgi:AcrR family transcriptional regulator
MSKTNLNTILEKSAKLYAGNGFENFTIRKLAKQIPISPSVIYHYFKDEEQLLISMFDYLNKDLGRKRAMLEQPKSAKQMLKQRIEFQLDNQEEIVAVLKYYLANRNKFPKFKNGFVPDKSALHIEEVLRFGSKTKEFYVRNLEDDAKVITHAINGFLLEYYPYFPQGNEKKQLVNRIYNFLIRALKGCEKK